MLSKSVSGEGKSGGSDGCPDANRSRRLLAMGIASCPYDTDTENPLGVDFAFSTQHDAPALGSNEDYCFCLRLTSRRAHSARCGWPDPRDVRHISREAQS